uniref:CCHC-type domain-containing protein n=1 Tax=Gallus gallus TaxID=9031 RepID=A0A8V0Y0E9_CHICK
AGRMHPSIADMIKACQDVGTASHKMALLADMLAARLDAGTAQRMKCYSCGEPGHVQRDCKKPKQAHKNACAIPTRPYMLAARLDAGTAQRMKCYSCGEPGHVQRDCKKPKQAHKNACAIPTRPCARCRRGLHWARECHQQGVATAMEPSKTQRNNRHQFIDSFLNN